MHNIDRHYQISKRGPKQYRISFWGTNSAGDAVLREGATYTTRAAAVRDGRKYGELCEKAEA